MNEIKFTQHKKLEDLFKENWMPRGTWANDCLLLAKAGEMMIYDAKKEEIIIKYSTEIKR